MLDLILKILVVSFFLNLLWELLHSPLYVNTLKMKLKRFVPYIILNSIKDSFWCTLIYLITVYLFKEWIILFNLPQLFSFVILALIFTVLDEFISVKKLHRWKYSKDMPRIFGFGITPSIELVATGIITFLIVFLII